MDSAFRRICAVPVRTIFWISYRLGLPGIILRYLSTPFFMTPRAPTTTGIVVVLSCHIFVVSISRSLYLDSFSNSFRDIFLSDGMVISISRHRFFFLSLIIMSGRLAFIVRSVCTEKSHSIVTSCVSVTGSGWCSYQCSAWGALNCLQTDQWMYCPTLSCLSLYSLGARTGHPDIIWSMVSVAPSQNLHLRSTPFLMICAW